jgi:hypothetical protein
MDDDVVSFPLLRSVRRPQGKSRKRTRKQRRRKQIKDNSEQNHTPDIDRLIRHLSQSED